ncbi:hypothetical protein, partial [Brucella abortus]|uniref:hypothetical protein n=3 Tax=Brucella TaxID=234 RepID=UPI001AEBAC60
NRFKIFEIFLNRLTRAFWGVENCKHNPGVHLPNTDSLEDDFNVPVRLPHFVPNLYCKSGITVLISASTGDRCYFAGDLNRYISAADRERLRGQQRRRSA